MTSLLKGTPGARVSRGGERMSGTLGVEDRFLLGDPRSLSEFADRQVEPSRVRWRPDAMGAMWLGSNASRNDSGSVRFLRTK
jgi:hypothetical protein